MVGEGLEVRGHWGGDGDLGVVGQEPTADGTLAANRERRKVQANVHLTFLTPLSDDGHGQRDGATIKRERQRPLGHVAVGPRDEGDLLESALVLLEPRSDLVGVALQRRHSAATAEDRVVDRRAIAEALHELVDLSRRQRCEVEIG